MPDRRSVVSRAARRVSGAQAAEDVDIAYARLEEIERRLDELTVRVEQLSAAMVRMAELHGDAMRRIADELVALRRER